MKTAKPHTEFRKSWGNPPWYSSYQENNYGELFYALVRIYKPNKIVELGTKAGYSAYHMARGLKDNEKGKLYCYDLWEKYEFNSVPKSLAQENLKAYSNTIRLKQRNVIGVDKLHKSTDILHIDLGNHGELLESIIPNWIDKTRQLIIIEGGSVEREKVYWMKKFKKASVRAWLKEFSLKHDIEYFTIEPFTSITLIRKA
jgi:hypothetical protein